MKKYLVSFLLSVVAKCAFCQQPTVFTPAQLLEDHQVLISALQELHPGLYRYLSKQEFDRLDKQLRLKLNKPMTEESYYRLVMPLIAQLKCGHTKWHRKDRPDDRYAFRQDDLFPLKLYFAGGRAYVLKNYHAKDMLAAGTEIISINGRKIPDLMRQLHKVITIDGNVQSTLYAELNQSFNGYYASFIETAPVYTVAFKEGSGKKQVKLPKVSLEIIRDSEAREKENSRPPLEISMPKAGTAVLRIDRFYTNKTERDFYAFIDSAFLAIKQASINALIIDLRNNEGGKEEYGGYLYSYLASKPFVYYRKITVASNKTPSVRQYAQFFPGYEQALTHVQEKDGEYLWPMQEYLAQKTPKPNAFNGKVYILTNGFSFSVTAEFASTAKTEKRAIFIGEETGGAYQGNNSGVFAQVVLPNTKLMTGIPLLGFYMNIDSSLQKDRGIQPDILKIPTVQDMLMGRDIVMENALEEAAKN